VSFATNDAQNAQPVSCYTFVRRDQVWRYTDQPEDVTVDGVVYRAAVIAHGDLQKDDESAAGEVPVTCAVSTPIVAALDDVIRSGPKVICTIRQTHRSGVGGVVTPASAVRFKGVVQSRRIAGGDCTFTVASLAGVLEKPMLRVITSPTCNNAIYDRLCGVDKTLYETTGCVITDIVGSVLTVAEAALQADGYYTAGPLVVEDGSAAGERLFVADHTGDQLTLLHPPPAALAIGDAVTLYAGCDGTEATCDAKFANLDYFLGFPRVPVTNPFVKAG
jgi:uncharacterized phage protein (TIGR02218 family)